MVLLAFFILLGISLVLYAQYQKTSMQRQATESFDREAVRIALKVAFYPELACSQGGVVNENCFDLQKVLAFAKKMKKGSDTYDENAFLFYETELRDSRMFVEQVFPEPNAASSAIIPFESCGQETNEAGETVERTGCITLYDNSPAAENNSFEKFPTFIPVTLRDETKGSVRKDALGMLVIEAYRTGFG